MAYSPPLPDLHRTQFGFAIFFGGAAHDTIRGIFADFLQPALTVNVLQQRVGVTVGGFGTLYAVKPRHDAVPAPDVSRCVTDTRTENLEFRPRVQLCVGRRRIKVGLFAFVFHIHHLSCGIGWFHLLFGGVQWFPAMVLPTPDLAAGRTAPSRRDVNQRQECSGLLDLVFQRLLY